MQAVGPPKIHSLHNFVSARPPICDKIILSFPEKNDGYNTK